MELIDELRRLGLPPKEAAVYHALLNAGTASVQAVARLAGIVRPTAYVILQSLERKGLVSKATGPDAKKTLFLAEPPERLSWYLEQQAHALQQRQKVLTGLLPDLRSAYARGEERPRVRLFEGKEGLKRLQREFIEASREPVVGMSPNDLLQALFPADSDEFRREVLGVRVKASIPTRYVYTSARGPYNTLAEDRAVLRESRFLSPKQLPITASFAVHGPLLSVVSFRSKILGVLIEHQDIADSFRAMFEVVWQAASPPVAEPAATPLTAVKQAVR